MSNISRRKFLKTGAAALAGITIAPSTILGMSHGHISPTDQLGSTQKACSTNSPRLKNTGTIVRCMRKWVNLSTV